MVAPAQRRIVTLANGFPPALNTLLPPENLDEGQIPEGRGFDVSEDGYIKKDVSIPTAAARIQKTVTLGTAEGETVANVPYLWEYNRLWNITGRTAAGGTSSVIHAGALHYDDTFFYQFPPIAFSEDANTIIALVPFSRDEMMVAKATGSYVLGNLSDTRGFFSRTAMIEELQCSAVDQIDALDGTVYVNTSDGMLSYSQGAVREVSLPLRGTSLASKAMKVDREKKYITLGSTHLYDIQNDKWFQYDGSTFSFKTRVLRQPDWSPFAVERILFGVARSSGTADHELTYKVKLEEEDWSDNYTVDVIYDNDKYTLVSETLEFNSSVRKFQLEITGIDANLMLRDISVDVENFNMDDYSA